jgi:GAF domain-containing protein/anti-sigma regulatory factor (Ser/Thr protein kinase)
MARAEVSPTELLQRLNRLVTALGTAASAADLPRVVLRQLATIFGASAARLTLTNEPLEPLEPNAAAVVTEYGDVELVPPEAWVSLDLLVGVRALGVIALGFEEPPAINAAERDSMHAAVALVAQAVENAHLADARQRADEATARLAFLGEVSNAVASSLELRELLDRLCAVGVPRLGDWSTILVPEGVALERSAGAHADPEKQALVDQLVGRFSVPLAGSSPIARAFRTGEIQVEPSVDRALVASIVDDREYIDTVLELSQGGALMVPLMVRGRAVGVITFALERAGRRFDDDDVWLARELAGRAAVGIDNASRYEQEHLVAELLQRAVLPERLPEPPALDLAARYLPAGPGVEVGGDWYDAFVLDDGGVGLVIGDVAGHDIAAASSMAQLRNALRAYALEGATPAVVLTRLNHLLCRSDDPLFASVIFGVLSPDRTRFRWANAGHPPMAIVHRAGTTLLTRPRGLVLGVRSDVDYPEGDVPVRPHDLLVLYTDGLIERRGENLEAGIGRLLSVAASAAARGPSADAVAERLLQTLLARHARADDVCLLTAWLLPTSEPAVEVSLPADPSSSRVARLRVSEALDAWDAAELADPVELLVSELVTNAVSHVGTGVRLRVERLPLGVRVRVYDGGDDRLPAPRHAVPPDEPTGRGLLIVDNVADRWGVERTESGKQVWFELSYQGAARRWARRAVARGTSRT